LQMLAVLQATSPSCRNQREGKDTNKSRRHWHKSIICYCCCCRAASACTLNPSFRCETNYLGVCVTSGYFHR
jgi:hypothetical protein